MVENVWRNGPVLLSEIEPRHLQVLEKIIQLPPSQQAHLEIIIDGLGTGKTTAQRTAAKNTVMTILNITEDDVALIKDIRQLSRVHQLDLQRFVQDQLMPDLEVESFTPAAQTATTDTRPPDFSDTSTEASSLLPVEDIPLLQEMDIASAASELADEEMPPLEEIPHEIPLTSDEFLEDLPSDSIETEEAAEPTELLEEEIDDTGSPLNTESAVEEEMAEVVSDYEMMEATLLESALLEEESPAEDIPENAETPLEEQEPDHFETELAQHPAEADEQQVSLSEEEMTSSEAEVVSEEVSKEVSVDVMEADEADTSPEATPSDNTVHISVLGKGLVVNSDRVIPHLSEALRQKLGLGFRNVFGLLKSEDAKAVDRLDKERLADLLSHGLVIEKVRYPVDYKTPA